MLIEASVKLWKKLIGKKDFDITNYDLNEIALSTVTTNNYY